MVAHSFNCFYLYLPPLTFITAFYFYIKFSFLYQISFFSTKESNKLVSRCFSVSFVKSIFIAQWDEQVIKSETKKIILMATKKERKVDDMKDLILKIIVKLALNFIISKVFNLFKAYVFKRHHIFLTADVHIGKRHLIMIFIWKLWL